MQNKALSFYIKQVVYTCSNSEQSVQFEIFEDSRLKPLPHMHPTVNMNGFTSNIIRPGRG